MKRKRRDEEEAAAQEYYSSLSVTIGQTCLFICGRFLLP